MLGLSDLRLVIKEIVTVVENVKSNIEERKRIAKNCHLLDVSNSMYMYIYNINVIELYMYRNL